MGFNHEPTVSYRGRSRCSLGTPIVLAQLRQWLAFLELLRCFSIPEFTDPACITRTQTYTFHTWAKGESRLAESLGHPFPGASTLSVF